MAVLLHQEIQKQQQEPAPKKQATFTTLAALKKDPFQTRLSAGADPAQNLRVAE